MSMRPTFFLSALALGWGVCTSAVAKDFTSPLIGFLEAGVVCAQDTGVVREAPDTVAGTTHVVDEIPPFVSTGRRVPAVIGIGFGVQSGLVGDLGQDGVLITVTQPPFAGSGATQQSFVSRVGSETVPSITFYQFDFGYELALGDWTMTASVGAATLYEVSFTVVPPAEMPELAGICGFTDLLG